MSLIKEVLYSLFRTFIWPLVIYITNLWPLSALKKIAARNLRKPGNGFFEKHFFRKLLEAANRQDEALAVEKCDIQDTDQVLEVGFGPGLGIQQAAKLVKKSAKGKVYGADFSDSMIEIASGRLEEEIRVGIVELHHASVAKLPFSDNSFDKIYHCNVYYFWDDCIGCCSELLRVLKPGGIMITVVELTGVSTAVDLGLLGKRNADVDEYMIALTNAGFIDVSMKEYNREGKLFGCVYAKVKTK